MSAGGPKRAQVIREDGLVQVGQERCCQNDVGDAVGERGDRAIAGFRHDELGVQMVTRHQRELRGVTGVGFNNQDEGHSYVRSMQTKRTAPAITTIASTLFSKAKSRADSVAASACRDPLTTRCETEFTSTARMRSRTRSSVRAISASSTAIAATDISRSRSLTPFRIAIVVPAHRADPRGFIWPFSASPDLPGSRRRPPRVQNRLVMLRT